MSDYYSYLFLRFCEYEPKAVMLCGWGVKAGMVCVWVAGKTV